MKTFGEILKEKRKALGLSRRKLSEICDITGDAIFLYENEKVFPNMINLIALADAFNCSMDELVGRTFKDKSLSVDLPCEVGDTVYFILKSENGFALFKDICDGFVIQGGELLIVLKTYRVSVSKYYLSSAEAEKVLKELQE